MSEEVWDCITKAPFGEQASVFTIVRDGDRFTGSNVADIGELPVIDGRIEGDRLIWKMPTDKPMRMMLIGKAVVDGDRLEGTVTLGPMGKAVMTGVRRG